MTDPTTDQRWWKLYRAERKKLAASFRTLLTAHEVNIAARRATVEFQRKFGLH